MSFYKPNNECPVCGRESEFKFIKDHKNQYGDFSLWQCHQCLVRFWLPFENPTAREWYEKTDPYNIKKNNQARKLHHYHKKFIELHKKEIVKNRILDLGCGTGEFVAELEKFGGEAWGTDIDQPAVEIAKKFNLKNVYPLPIENFFEKENLPSFDYITIFEVLEHVGNPLEIIKKAKNLLTPEGKIVISLPSRKRIFPELSEWDYPLHHLSRWSPEALRKFLSLAGYKNIKIRIFGKFHYLYELSLQLIIPKKLVAKTKKEISRAEGPKESNNKIKQKILKSIYPLARLIAVFLIPYLLTALLFLPTVIFFPRTGSLYVEAEKN